MLNALIYIFTPGNFEAHIVHFLPDNMGLVWFMVAGNALIALSYTLIPIALLYLVRKRKDIMFTPIFFLFAAFIVLCGLTHVMHIMIFWYPAYWLEGIVLALTGVISIFTFFAMLYVLPMALKLRTPKELEGINAKLSAEIESRKKAEEGLKQKNAEVEKNNQEIAKSNERLSTMNKAMVGRELKMKELKSRIQELETENSQLKEQKRNGA